MKKTFASGGLLFDLNPWLRSKAKLLECFVILIFLLTISVSCQNGGTSGDSSGTGVSSGAGDSPGNGETFKADNLQFAESSPQLINSTINSSWELPDIDITTQSIQFYSDDECENRLGSEITIPESQTQYSRTFSGIGTYAFKVILTDSSGDKNYSDCSPAMAISDGLCDDGKLYYDGTCVTVSNDINNCLDRDYDGHKSIFCGGTDLNDLNSSVNPDLDEICGDGFDNNQDGKKDYEDTVNCPHASNPVTYHVDPVNGIDSTDNDGSETAPFRTIAYVNSLVKSGDTVLLHAGYYGDINLVETSNPYDSVDNLDNPAPFYTDWVTYKAAPGDEKLARLGHLQIGTSISTPDYHSKYPKDSIYARSGPNNPTLREFYISIQDLTIEDGISIYDGKFVELKNNLVKRIGPISSATDCSVYFDNTGINFYRVRYAIIDGNEVTHTAHGIHGSGHDLIIKNNHIHHITHDGMGITGGTNILIEANLIHNTDDGYNDNAGTSCNIHSDGFQPYVITYYNGADIHYSINNLSFKRNKIYHTESMIIMLQTSPYTQAYQNYLNEGTALPEGWQSFMSEIQLRNFLFENNIFGPSGGFLMNIIADYFDGFIFRHNTLMRVESDSYVSDLGRTLDADNFWVRITGDNSTKVQVYNNIFPVFADVRPGFDFGGYNYHDVNELSWYDDTDYYHDSDMFKNGSDIEYFTDGFSGELTDASRLIDAGTRYDTSNVPLDMPVTRDFNGDLRGELPDIGAIEH